MNDWKNAVAAPTSPITEAIRIIDASSLQICLVLDAAGRLLGTVTDGDVRRAILKAVNVSDPVTTVMNAGPVTGSADRSRDTLLSLMRARRIHHLPIVDSERRVIDLVLLEDLIQFDRPDNWIVLMAGGLGTRLHPLTADVPKPMLKVGTRPLLEIILANLIKQGFHRYLVSVNYLSDVIKQHLGDGSKFGAEIVYLDESKRMGTAGPLSLIPFAIEEPLIVMNGDLLTKVDMRRVLDFHREHEAVATLAVRDYEFQVPYGVVRIEQDVVTGIDEKPVHNFFVNAGIYVLEPDVISTIPKDTFYDMPTVVEKLVGVGRKTVAYPIREYWLDIGQMDDFAQANREFLREFSED